MTGENLVYDDATFGLLVLKRWLAGDTPAAMERLYADLLDTVMGEHLPSPGPRGDAVAIVNARSTGPPGR